MESLLWRCRCRATLCVNKNRHTHTHIHIVSGDVFDKTYNFCELHWLNIGIGISATKSTIEPISRMHNTITVSPYGYATDFMVFSIHNEHSKLFCERCLLLDGRWYKTWLWKWKSLYIWKQWENRLKLMTSTMIFNDIDFVGCHLAFVRLRGTT